MGKNSKITWCTHTFNPWVGCQKVSPACDNCYAETWAKRSGHPELWQGERRRTKTWGNPIKWDREAKANGIRPKVFCASLADVFDVKIDPLWREDLFNLIDLTPNLDWLLLTKRPKVAAEYFNGDIAPPNVWVGATVENEAMVKARLRHLMKIRARVRFLSMEPLLEPVILPLGLFPEWIIVGAESGSKRRPFSEDWVRGLRDQCVNADTPFFYKQNIVNGKKIETPPLDGQRWAQYPK